MLSSGLRGQLYNQDNNGKRLLDETGSCEDLPGCLHSANWLSDMPSHPGVLVFPL